MLLIGLIILQLICSVLTTTNDTIFDKTTKLQHINLKDNSEKLKHLEYCINKSLFYIKLSPLLITTDCCLTELCTRKAFAFKSSKLKEIILKLCSEHSFLLKEQLLSACNSYNKINNFITMSKLHKIRCSIINCTDSLQKKIIIDEMPQLNYFRIANDAKIESVHLTSINAVLKTRKTKNIPKSSARNSSLQFLDVPTGDKIHHLKFNDDKYLLFGGFSSLIGYLLSSEFPTELFRYTLDNQVPFQVLAFQLLKTEYVAMGWLLVWILPICLTFIVVSQLCCRKSNIERLNEDSSNVSLNFSNTCTKRTFELLLYVLLILLIFPIMLLLASNEQISKYVEKSAETTSSLFKEVDIFIRNSEMQMSFVATSSMDITVEAIRADFENIENILGKPFQEDLASETGIDIALNALDELKIATNKVTTVVTDLLEECGLARAAGIALQEQLDELDSQLKTARQECLPQDRALCDTLQCAGLDVTFSCDNLTADIKIKQLERMGIENMLNKSIDDARQAFDNVPIQVILETESHIAEINSLLTKRRTEVYKSVHELDKLTKSVSESIRVGEQFILKLIEQVSYWDLWRWWTILGISAALFVVWGLLLCGAPCGCGLTSKTISFLVSGTSLSCVMCLVVWILGAVSFLVGGHCQSLLCQTLYDSPQYKGLGDLVDTGGIIYENDGLFEAFSKRNNTLKIKDVLKNCQRNQPVYPTFHLDDLLNLKLLTNYKSWDDLKRSFSNFTIGTENNLEILTPSLQLNLQLLSTISTINLTDYRRKMSTPVTKKDLSSFADQIVAVARQLNDLSSSKNSNQLALLIRTIMQNEMKQLVNSRDQILYQLTMLEILIQPLNKQANQSLAHLKTIQYYLNNEGWQIREKNNKRFILRIESYLKNLHSHITHKIEKNIGKCRPLWDVFHSFRFYICSLMVDPMNGISLMSFLLILLFLGMCPVVVKLVDYYKEINERQVSTVTHRRTRNDLVFDVEDTWATPPSAERALVNIAARTSTVEVPHISSVSRVRSPKRVRDSVHLIELNDWETSANSLRSWR